eukprot:CAMPEP_0174268104 /NCGR_PEP_ID=MMETSP0439-20130205/36132_1 /TAXON_ID=0 /ORGANISM="Stereomyxa ramosa, Strain Chinc5" /LENGTH=174 /DNA_ID=CAMNT_0015356067 /DNA_START=26 /DNA_END=550 /DNA_ORIENTATION=-
MSSRLDKADLQAIGETFSSNWQAAYNRGKLDELVKNGGIFTKPNFTFKSPAVHKSYTDPQTIEKLLSCVLSVLQGLYYVGHCVGVDVEGQFATVVLIFKAHVCFLDEQGEKKVLDLDGVDIFKVNTEGQAFEMMVMIRPMKVLLKVAEQMGQLIMGGASPPKLPPNFLKNKSAL